MTRRWCLWGILALAGCREKAGMPPDLFPQSAGPDWKLVEVRDLRASEAPDPVPPKSVEKLRAATYKAGDAEIRARVYLLHSADEATALATRWQASADTVVFNQGKYFAVLNWQHAPRAAVQQFVADLEKRLGAVTTKPRP